jgi:multidrug efflux pump subunit AcrB
VRSARSVRKWRAMCTEKLVRIDLSFGNGALLFGGGIFGLSLRTPTGFLPEEDQGAFFMSVQLPDGASVARTSEVVTQVEKLMLGLPQVSQTFSVIGYSLLDGGNEANNGFLVIKLKPFEDRARAD